MVFNCIQCYSLVFNGIQWSRMVSDGLGWSWMVSDGLRWTQMVLDGLSQLISITIEWFKTSKPISGLGLDWVGLGWMDLRVGGGIEPLRC